MADPVLPALDAKSDPKTEFFMAASHQLKSPVAIVQWCLQSIMEKPGLDADTKKLSEKALSQADAMSVLLADMLRVFRIMHKGDKQVQNLAPINMNKLLDEVMKQEEPLIQRQNVKVQMGAIEQLPLVLADEAYLKQAIINILDNAVKYSHPGGSVEVSAEVKKGMIELTITDHGIGIPEAEQSRMFTEFFRGELAKNQTDNGTGLGLVLVKHILEGIGGSVCFTSAPAKGSSFILKIPTAAA